MLQTMLGMWESPCAGTISSPGGTVGKKNGLVECLHCVSLRSCWADPGTQTPRLTGPEGPDMGRCTPLPLLYGWRDQIAASSCQDRSWRRWNEVSANITFVSVKSVALSWDMIPSPKQELLLSPRSLSLQ